MRIPKATVKSIVPETMNTLSLRTFKMTKPRRQPVTTDVKLDILLSVSIRTMANTCLDSPVQRHDPGGRNYRFAKADNKDSIQIVTLNCPCCVTLDTLICIRCSEETYQCLA